MDINLARTFLTVAETGSFIDTARRLNLTQSTVSARIKTLEEHLAAALFSRSKSGATLTDAGEQFRRHAIALVRVWEHAQRDIAGSDRHRDHLTVAAPISLWDGFLIKWLAWLRTHIPDIAVAANAQHATVVTQRMLEGTLDLAVVYRPTQLAGIVTEHLFDEEYALVTSVRAGARRSRYDHAYLDWGPDFDLEHEAEYPQILQPDINLSIGVMGVEYLLEAPATAYCPIRLVKKHLARNRLRIVPRSRRVLYPVYMLYPELRDEEAYEPILNALRRDAKKLGRKK